MILPSYTQTRANKLIKLRIPKIESPFEIDVLWIRAISLENSEKAISKRRHRHSFFEVHFVVGGSISYQYTGSEIRRVEKGHGIIFPPECDHKVLDFDCELIKISVAFATSKRDALLERLANKGPVYFSSPDTVHFCLDSILSEVDSKSVLSDTLIKNHVFAIICSLLRICGVDSVASDAKKNILEQDNVHVSLAKQYIDDNKNVFLTCEAVAQYCHFNVKYLGRLFKEQTGLSLLQYIHQSKVKEAERLLSDTSLSLKEVGRLLGFANEYYFNSFFKKHSGMSPGTYRRLSQKG